MLGGGSLFFPVPQIHGRETSEALRAGWEDVDYSNLEIILRRDEDKGIFQEGPDVQGTT